MMPRDIIIGTFNDEEMEFGRLSCLNHDWNIGFLERQQGNRFEESMISKIRIRKLVFWNENKGMDFRKARFSKSGSGTLVF
jgi:hypothetical protein